VLGEVHQTTSVADKSSTDKFTDKGGKVRGNGLHSVSQVIRELSSVFGDRNHLVAERVDVGHIGIGNLGTHRKLGSGFDGGLEVFRKDELERGGDGVGSETCGLVAVSVSC